VIGRPGETIVTFVEGKIKDDFATALKKARSHQPSIAKTHHHV
jgi:hypothetical protein